MVPDPTESYYMIRDRCQPCYTLGTLLGQACLLQPAAAEAAPLQLHRTQLITACVIANYSVVCLVWELKHTVYAHMCLHIMQPTMIPIGTIWYA